MSDSYKGAITLLATDIVGSSALWESEMEAMQAALAEHDSLVLGAIESHGGEVFKTTGDGCLAVFYEAAEAARCARAVLALAQGREWPTSSPIRLKAALHSGPTIQRDGDHFGPTVNRVARLLDVAEPGVVVLSLATYALLDGNLPEGSAVRSAGHRDLKGIAEPMQVFEMVDGEGAATPVDRPAGPLRVSGAWPAAGKPFIGRRAEVKAISDRLGRGQALVTVTGPGGIGKTRTVCTIVEAATQNYPDGSLFVDCQSLATESEVALAIVEGLGGSPRAGNIEDAALELLRSRRLLLALDCYEALADRAELPRRILDSAPGVDVLVGSRAVLGLEREAEIALQPLPLQSQVSHQGTSEALFFELARLADSEFEDTKENRDAVRRVCELLEGVPLLLTIAAARLRHTGIYELADQIASQGASRISGPHRDTAPRHADIHTVVADSVRLLESQEAAVLYDLAVFPGGALYGDIEAVLGPRHPDLERAVFRLRDHSLLLAANTRGRKRFRMLDSVREAVQETGPPEPDLLRAHALHYGHRAEKLRTLTERGELSDLRYLLLSESGNLRAATEFAVNNRDKDLMRGLFRSLALGLQTCGMWDDYLRLAQSSRDLLGAEVEVEALGLDGALFMRKGNRPAAMRAWRQRAETCARAADPVGEADAWLDIAEALLTDGDTRNAACHAVRGLHICRKHNIPAHLATAWAVGAEIGLARGNTVTALRRADRAAETIDDSPLSIYVHLARGRVYSSAGRLEEALRCFLAGVDAANRLALLLSLIQMLSEAAVAYCACGEPGMEALAWTTLIGLDRDIGANRSGRARKELARLRKEFPAQADEARRLVTGSGWEAGVSALTSTP
ncbi:MAG: adenylate/guanylate cyclase domain-containing protein [Fimbriimonadaceae bacterium]